MTGWNGIDWPEAPRTPEELHKGGPTRPFTPVAPPPPEAMAEVLRVLGEHKQAPPGTAETAMRLTGWAPMTAAERAKLLYPDPEDAGRDPSSGPAQMDPQSLVQMVNHLTGGAGTADEKANLIFPPSPQEQLRNTYEPSGRSHPTLDQMYMDWSLRHQMDNTG